MRMTTRLSLPLFLLTAISPLVLSACTSPTGTTKDMFDMTSSTTGRTWFTEDGIIKDDYKVLTFTTLNFTVLKQNMAQGEGDYLISLGALLGVLPERRDTFASLTQARYAVLVKSDRATPTELLDSLTQVMAAHPGLQKSLASD